MQFPRSKYLTGKTVRTKQAKSLLDLSAETCFLLQNCPVELGFIVPCGHHQPAARLSSLHDANTSEAIRDI